jgi:transcriptional regulator with XRE-family HTH domain
MPKKTFVLAWRERRKISQRKAEKLLGCSRGAIISWERGLHETPKYIILAIKAIEAGITAD